MAVEILRDGNKVSIILDCVTEYEAIETFDRLNEELANGYASLEIETKR